MYERIASAAGRIKEPRERILRFGPFSGGLVTSRPPEHLRGKDCLEMLNIVIGSDGIPKTRPGMALTTILPSTQTSIDFVRDVKVSGTWYTIIASTASGPVYRLYYKNGYSATQIGNDTTFEGEISFVGFNDLLIIFDGGYPKYWDGTSVGLVEDQGIGPRPAGAYLVQNLNAELDSIAPVQVGAYEIATDAAERQKYGIPFTTPDVNTNFDVPTIRAKFNLARVGDGTTSAGNYITAVVRNKTTYASLASKNLVLPEQLPAITSDSFGDADSYEEHTVEFTQDDYAFVADTEYLMCIEFANGTVASGNYPVVMYSGDHSADAGTRFYFYNNTTTAWALSAVGIALCVDVLTFAPPELSVGIVHANRIFAFDSEASGKLWYCGAGNHLDWSSPDSGGYLDAGREIGGIASFYNTVWVFGTENTPALGRITGDSPASYALTDSIQKVSSHQKAIVTTPDDIIFTHAAGVSSINSMQEFGDIRSATRSDNIEDTIQSLFDATAFAVYEPTYGLYLLKLNDNTDNVFYAFHTKTGQGRFPVSKWMHNLTETSDTPAITAFGTGQGKVYLGAVDGTSGRIFEFKMDSLQDYGQYPTYSIKSHYYINRHEDMTATRYGINIRKENQITTTEPSFKLKFYRNFSTTSFLEKTLYLPKSVQSEALPDSDSKFLRGFMRGRVNFDFFALMVGVEDITPQNDREIFFGGIEIIAR